MASLLLQIGVDSLEIGAAFITTKPASVIKIETAITNWEKFITYRDNYYD